MRDRLKLVLAVLALAILVGVLTLAFVLNPDAVAPWVQPGP